MREHPHVRLQHRHELHGWGAERVIYTFRDSRFGAGWPQARSSGKADTPDVRRTDDERLESHALQWRQIRAFPCVRQEHRYSSPRHAVEDRCARNKPIV